MRNTIKLLSFYCLTLASCGPTDEKRTVLSDTSKTIVDTPQKKIVLKAPPINVDTLIVDKKTAVFYEPNSLQIKKRKKEIGEADFMTGADDYINYLNTSKEYLQKQGLPVIDSKDKKFLKFVSSGSTQVIRLDTLPELWGIYFFDAKSEPFHADMTIIEDEYKKYYK